MLPSQQPSMRGGRTRLCQLEIPPPPPFCMATRYTDCHGLWLQIAAVAALVYSIYVIEFSNAYFARVPEIFPREKRKENSLTFLRLKPTHGVVEHMSPELFSLLSPSLPFFLSRTLAKSLPQLFIQCKLYNFSDYANNFFVDPLPRKLGLTNILIVQRATMEILLVKLYVGLYVACGMWHL